MNKLRLLSPALIVLSLLSLSSLSAKAASDQEWDRAAIASATRDTASYLAWVTNLSSVSLVGNEGILYGLLLTSQSATGAFVTLRDTNTANNSSDSFATVFFSSQTGTGANNAGFIWTPPFPIRIQNGLSITASNCPTYGSGQVCVTALFRKVFR